MKQILLITTLLFSLQSYCQKIEKIKEPKLYVEPQSIQAVNGFWKYKNNGKVVKTIVIGGVRTIGLDVCESNVLWKRPTNDGWVYRPFIMEINIKNK